MLPTLPALHDAVRAPPMLGDLFDIAGQHFDRFANRGALVLVERGVEFAPGSPLERDGFEPSVPAKSEVDFRASLSPHPSRFHWRDRGSESVSLQRGVKCEPEDDIDIPVRHGSTITIRSRSTTSRRDSRVAERLSRMAVPPANRRVQRPLKG